MTTQLQLVITTTIIIIIMKIIPPSAPEDVPCRGDKHPLITDPHEIGKANKNVPE